jgi:DNA-binding FadR family transcriptional regulator
VAEQPFKYLAMIFAKERLNTEKDVTDLNEARILLETEVVELCAQRANDDDMALLERNLEEMKTSILQGGAGFRDLDLAFHLAVAGGSKNQVLTEMLNRVLAALEDLISKSLQVSAGMEMAYKQHEEIVEFLKQRNPARARSRMHNHLRAFQRGYKVLFRLPQ